MAASFSKTGHRPDYFLFALVLVLTAFGLTMLASASSDVGKVKFGDTYYYLKHQLLYGLSFGIAGFVAALFVNYQRYRRIAFPLLLVSLVFLVLVFTRFGIASHGASRWLRLGPISFQPAEILKLTFVLYLAAWLANPKMKRERTFAEGLLPFLIISGLIAALLLLQPATSTVVILLSAGLVIYFLSGAAWKYVGAVALLGAVGIGLVVYLTPYRWERVMSFLKKGSDMQGTNYQLAQARAAISAGGLWGAGYGNSSVKAGTLPAPVDDSIFAVIAEELGFAGAGALIALFGILTFRLFWLATKVRDRFGKLILIGFGTIIAFQSFVNMASISGLLPLTGVPLPFVSYGGTALAVFLTMSGVAVNVSRYT